MYIHTYIHVYIYIYIYIERLRALRALRPAAQHAAVAEEAAELQGAEARPVEGVAQRRVVREDPRGEAPLHVRQRVLRIL